jgi:hypothetical protein
MLGIEPVAGRVVELEDEHQRRHVAVISHLYWQRAFGGNADALDKELHLERGAFQNY